MAKKSRDPSKLSHDDLVTWSKDEVDWLNDHAGDPDLTPRAADFVALATAYEDAYNAEISPEQLAPLLHDELEDLDDVLIDVLRLLRGRIPLLPGVAEPKLAPFGLGDDVPTDWDKLVAVATVCRDHWLDISGGGVPPEFAAVSVNMTAMVSAANEFITKHTAYRASLGDKQDAVAYKNQCRDALLECEREIFHWYRAAHPDADDIWWRSTPWGTSSDSSGGGTSWDQAPVGKMSIAPDPLDGILAGCEEYDGTKRFDLRIVGVKKNDPVPEMPLVDTYTDIEQPALLDADGFPLQKNFVYYLWIRARKDGEVSEWSEVVGMLWE